jgi:predicted DCC family thiol-disulfide oxidoreductase YuxK
MTSDLRIPARSCTLLYDGECPMCATFASLTSRDSEGLSKADARQESSLREKATQAGMDLDYGIVVEDAGRLYYGPEAIHHLAHRPHSTLLLNLIYLPFRSLETSRLLYPFLVQIRRALLTMKRKPPIHNLREKQL